MNSNDTAKNNMDTENPRSERSWTKEQQEAISHRGDDMLVSAAAGAGKTAVMVERIIKIIAEEKVPVTDLLVVTFTNAAASEMKEKIRTALKKKASSLSGRDASFFRDQIARLEDSDISTFDAFTRRVIRQFFYLINADPGARVSDTAETAVLMEDSLDELFTAEFNDNRPDFIDFLDKYTDEKSVDKARKMVSDLYTVKSSLPDGDELLERCADSLSMDGEEFKKTGFFKALQKEIEGLSERALSFANKTVKLLSDSGCQALAETADMERQQIEGINESLKSGDLERFSDLVTGYSTITLRAKKDEKDAYNAVKDKVKALRASGYNSIMKDLMEYAFPGGDISSEINPSAGGAKTLVRLTERFDDIYTAKKSERGVMDFTDMEALCYKILCKEEAADYYKKKFKYIFIDEYQDTSVMQEAIIRKIATEGSLFMVGDVKQSIYGFRQAKPEIFLQKYRSYPKDADDSHKIKIELNKNFRSCPGVIRGINGVFENVMDGYDDAAALHPGRKPEDYPEEGLVKTIIVNTGDASDEDESDGFKTEVAKPKAGENVAAADKAGGERADATKTEAVKTGGERADATKTETVKTTGERSGSKATASEFQDLTAGQLEICETARLIKQLVKEKIKDSDGNLRNVRYSDIVIIRRSISSHAEEYRKIFTEAGIPLYVDDRDGFLKTSEIGIFMDLLSLIDNRYQDLPLISVLRGVFGFNERELAEIRRLRLTGSYAEACMDIAENASAVNDGSETAEIESITAKNVGTQNAGVENAVAMALGAKLRNVFNSLDKWHEMSLSMPLGLFIWRLMTDSGFYLLSGTMPDPERRQANLRLLADRAESFSRDRQVSLYDFLRYIDAMKNGSFDMPQAVTVGENDNVVRLMTIHHSKGLEFPIVITAGLGGRLQYTKSDRPVMFDEDIGIGLQPKEPETFIRKKSLIYKAEMLKLHESEKKEQLRVLYVALTRAQQRLYLIGTSKDPDKLLDQKDLEITSDGSYFDMMIYIPNPEIVDGSGLGTETSGAAASRPKSSYASMDEIASEVDRRLSYRYKYSAASGLKLKYSVSEINREHDESEMAGGKELSKTPDSESVIKAIKEAEERAADNVPEFIRKDTRVTAARKGTVYHTIMEHLDFPEAVSRGMDHYKERTAELVNAGIITSDELKAVDPERILAFFRTDIGKKCAGASAEGRLRREQSFVLRIRKAGEDCYIQGIIDCWVEAPDGLILIDYKSGRIDRAHLAEEEQRVIDTYGTQMKIYRRALEEATGRKVLKTYLYLFGADKFVEVN